MKDKKYVYSFNDEEYMELDSLLNLLDDKDGKEVEFVYKGECIPYTHSDFLMIEEVIEDITNRAYEEGEEYSDSYCDELELKVHKDNLEKIILDYLNSNVKQPSFYKVENSVKIAVNVLKEEFDV